MSQPNATPAMQTAASPRKPATHFRLVILGLLFFATTINYLDRNVMGILAKDLKELFSISDSQYGDIQSAFALAYACGQLVCGRLLDIIGVRTTANQLTARVGQGERVRSVGLRSFARYHWRARRICFGARPLVCRIHVACSRG